MLDFHIKVEYIFWLSWGMNPKASGKLGKHSATDLYLLPRKKNKQTKNKTRILARRW
jgi:hypothetical protein